MEDLSRITWFHLLWTAFWIFVVSLVSQVMSDSPKTRKEKIYIALAAAIIFTFPTLGIIPTYSGNGEGY